MECMRKLATPLLLGIILYHYVSPSYALAHSDTKDIEISIQEAIHQQSEIESEILDLHEELELITIELSEVWNVIRDYDEKLAILSDHIIEYNKEYEEQLKEVGKLKSELKRMESIQETNLNYFKERLRAMYQTHHSYLDVLFGSTSFGDFIAKIQNMRQIVEFDNEIYLNYQNMIEKLRKQEEKIEYETTLMREKKEQLEELNKYIIELQEEKKGYLHRLTEEMKNKQRKIQSKEEEKMKYKRKEEGLKRELQNRNRLLNDVQNDMKTIGITTSGEGIFIVPTQGRYSSSFGPRWGKMHNGIDIANKIGTPVVAAASGTVKWAHYVNGYGNTVLLSHEINGRTYETLYAHLNKINVKVGQQVTQGEKIGEMGNTGFSYGSHLHFEIHVGQWNQKKSNAVDPLKLLSK